MRLRVHLRNLHVLPDQHRARPTLQAQHDDAAARAKTTEPTSSTSASPASRTAKHHEQSRPRSRARRSTAYPESLAERLMSKRPVTRQTPQRPEGSVGSLPGSAIDPSVDVYAGALPDRITIYRRAICAMCNSETQVVQQVRRTVIHEVGHHFGIGDARLRELGVVGRDRYRAPSACEPRPCPGFVVTHVTHDIEANEERTPRGAHHHRSPPPISRPRARRPHNIRCRLLRKQATRPGRPTPRRPGRGL